MDITAIILTKDESENIRDCINSVKDYIKRIVIVDSGSTDDTVKIAKELGADVYFNEFNYYAQQFNWAIDNCKINTEWTLRLDADERFTPSLFEEIKEILKTSNERGINGVTMEAWLYFMGKKLRYGASKKRKLMLFRTGKGRIEDRRRDAHTVISGGKTVSTREKFIHYDYKNLNNFIDKYNKYASREFKDYLDYLEGKDTKISTDEKIQRTRENKFGIYYKAPSFIRARLWYIYNYYFKLGFLDGREGQIYHYLECYWYRYLVDAIIFENQKEIKD